MLAGPKFFVRWARRMLLLCSGENLSGQIGFAMARCRYQRGCLILKGDRWFGTWREDLITKDGLKRIRRKAFLGTKTELPTRRLAQRELDKKLEPVNKTDYRPSANIAFWEFVDKWRKEVMVLHKRSTQAAEKSVLKCVLVPAFGNLLLKDITAELIQSFVASQERSPKTTRNAVGLMKLLWKTARAWGYVTHNPFEGKLRMPQGMRQEQTYFTRDEMKRIIRHATGQTQLFLWLLSESGLRAGEMCGLRVGDIEFESQTLSVCQSVWHGQTQMTKTRNAVRSVRLSRPLTLRLKRECRGRGPNEFVFRTSNGTPLDADTFLKRKVKPVLRALKLSGNLKSFRHGQATEMDRQQVPLKVRESRMGHYDASLTQRVYTHAVSADEKKFVESLGKHLAPRRVRA